MKAQLFPRPATRALDGHSKGMAKTVKFAKVVGTGNDFILVDGRNGYSLGANPARFAREWCDRKRGIGADGLLVLLPSRKGDARMEIYNSDGSRASMCGNGLRCVVWYLHAKDHGKKEITVETGAGVMKTRVIENERTRIYMTPPKDFRLGIKLTALGKKYLLHQVNTGVPHAVLFVSNLDKVETSSLGPVIRHHKFFKPAGTNVNWVRTNSPHEISIRTFERGVEGETLACGTGAVATAVIGTVLGKLQPPVHILTASGERLTVGFHREKNPWEDLYLEGPARILFEGVIRL